MAHEVNVRNEEELIAFAQALNGLSDAMVQNFNKAKAEMYRVNEGWNDEQNQQFMQQFEQSVQVINQIGQMMNDYSAYMRRYAAAIQQVKNIR